MIGNFFQNLQKSLQELSRIDYDGLAGLPSSLGRDAGAWALEGEVPVSSNDGKYLVASFAGGCFWGTELHFQRLPGVIATCVGYTQGDDAKPTYAEVCTGTTGHTEGLQLLYDPAEIEYGALVEKLFSTIDPTLLNRVGNDRGTQYRHGIYTHSQEQAKVAHLCMTAEQAKHARPIVTELKPASVFWPAEEYHQQYLQKGGQDASKGAQVRVRCYG